MVREPMGLGYCHQSFNVGSTRCRDLMVKLPRCPQTQNRLAGRAGAGVEGGGIAQILTMKSVFWLGRRAYCCPWLHGFHGPASEIFPYPFAWGRNSCAVERSYAFHNDRGSLVVKLTCQRLSLGNVLRRIGIEEGIYGLQRPRHLRQPIPCGPAVDFSYILFDECLPQLVTERHTPQTDHGMRRPISFPGFAHSFTSTRNSGGGAKKKVRKASRNPRQTGRRG